MHTLARNPVHATGDIQVLDIQVAKYIAERISLLERRNRFQKEAILEPVKAKMSGQSCRSENIFEQFGYSIGNVLFVSSWYGGIRPVGTEAYCSVAPVRPGQNK
ncbi:jg20503 [Pararge aegeria aegeria]|uniref:Jg20503 protein n=1 Tax=Pararge aegeria aegeria TaxID=348720 RepID=A0A8S4QVL1_9NEOP|nr:jg20503 [Pararge aegeria aegeria]